MLKMVNANFAENLSMAFGSRSLVFIAGFVIAFFAAASVFAQEKKEPNVAGSFYPQDPSELSETIDSYIGAAEPGPVEGNIFALISPHAGYSFSGQVASFGYKLIKIKRIKPLLLSALVIITLLAGFQCILRAYLKLLWVN